MRCALVVLALLVLAWAGPATAERRVALVIGNGAYQHATELPNAANDGGDVAAALTALGFEVIQGTDLDRAGMEGAVREFARALAGADAGLFFYAGHGLQVAGRNYLVPVDAALEDEADLAFEAIPIDVVLSQMERQTPLSIVILDACRDNPLARTLARSMGASRSTAIGRGLAAIQSTIGTLIAYSTAPDNVALDGTGRNSPFTSALLQHLRTPGLEVRQMLTRVRQSVWDASGGRQLPWDNSSLMGDFYFVPADGAPQVAAVSPPTPAAPPDPAEPARIVVPVIPDPNADRQAACEQSAGAQKVAVCSAAIASGRWAGADLAWAYFERGLAHHALEDYEAALADHEQAVALDPEDPYPYYGRAEAYRLLEQYDRALDDYARAIAIDPTDAYFFFDRGQAYLALERYREAIADFDAAIALDADEPYFFADRAWAHYDLAQYRQAVADFDQAIRRDAGRPDFFYGRGLARQSLGEHAAAVADFDQAMRLGQDDAETYNLRAWSTYAAGGDLQQALADTEHALELEPGTATILDTQAHILTALGHIDEAMATFEQVVFGDEGPEWIAKYQEAINGHGYGPVAVDGVWGEATRKAMRTCLEQGCRIFD